MLRLDRASGAVTLVSRLARPPALAVLVALLAALAVATLRYGAPRAAVGLGAAAAAVVVLGGRSVRATFSRGRVSVTPAVPLQRRAERPLSEFERVEVESVAEARARRAARVARGYHARSGAELPAWLRPPTGPGANDHLRRLVLRSPAGDPLPLTAWLPPEDDLDAARAEIEALLR
jgi:hypothetical protein